MNTQPTKTALELICEQEVAILCNAITEHLPKSIEREALGDEVICNAIKTVYPKFRELLLRRNDPNSMYRHEPNLRAMTKPTNKRTVNE